MNRILKHGWKVAGLFCLLLFASCSSTDTDDDDDEVKKHHKKGDPDWYTNWQASRQRRGEVRQERTDAWYRRIMGNPVKTDTGLKVPD